MAQLFLAPYFIAWDSNNAPVPGAQIYFTLEGTNTASAPFQDAALSTPHANPVVANGVGQFPPMFLDPNVSYRVRVYAADATIPGATPLEEYDPYEPGSQDLSISGGSALVGYIASGGSAVARTAQAKMRDLKSVKDYGALGDGLTDDRAAFNAASTTFLVPPGNYLINSNVSLGDVLFLPGAELTIATGATVTFTGSVTAPEAQIFNLQGTAAVAGLRRSKAVWFAGDKLNTTTDALAELQAAANAAASSGEVEFPLGFFTITGATAISFTKGQQVFGVAPFASEVRYTGLASYVFLFSTTIGGSLRNISVYGTNTSPPTSGQVLTISAGYFVWENVIIRNGYVGINASGTISALKGLNFKLLDCMSVGLSLTAVNDVYIDNFLVSAPNDWLTLSGGAGTLVAGETITGGTSGATAIVGTVISSTAITAQVAAKNFTIGETITGGTSGATRTVGAQTVPLALGGIRLANKVEAFIASNGDVIGGKYGMTTAAASYTLGNRPAYNKFHAVYFDSADSGVLIDKAVEFDFSDCWFSNRPSVGISISNSDGMRFNGGGAINCYQHGVFVDSTALRTVFNGFAARGNGVQTANTFDGIAVNANTTDFLVSNCTLGGSIGFGSQRYGINVLAGTSDRYIVADNLVAGNTTAGVFDGGTGVNKRVANNY